jgi:hypothetical protein
MEGRLSRTVRELNNATAQARDYKTKHDAVSAEVTQLKAKLDSAKANPLDLLDELGWDLEKLAKGVVEQGLRPRAQRMELPPEIRQEIDDLKRDRQQRQEREQRDQFQQMRTNQVATIKNYIGQNAESFPFAAAVDWAAESVWDSAHGSGAADGLPMLRSLEESFAANTAAVLGNERALKALLTSNPKLRETLAAALGASAPSKEAPPEASNGSGNQGADGPRSVSSIPSGQSAPPPNKQSKEGRKRADLKAFREFLRSQSAE